MDLQTSSQFTHTHTLSPFNQHFLSHHRDYITFCVKSELGQSSFRLIANKPLGQFSLSGQNVFEWLLTTTFFVLYAALPSCDNPFVYAAVESKVLILLGLNKRVLSLLLLCKIDSLQFYTLLLGTKSVWEPAAHAKHTPTRQWLIQPPSYLLLHKQP